MGKCFITPIPYNGLPVCRNYERVNRYTGIFMNMLTTSHFYGMIIVAGKIYLLSEEHGQDNRKEGGRW